MAIPTNMTREPQTDDTIEASRVRDHANVGTAKRYIEGLDPSLAGTTLTILASPAWGVYVGGNLWRRLATEANHVETLTDDAVNHVYFAPNGNIEVNTSGTPADAGSVKLYTITVTSGTPVLTSDDRSTLFDFSDGATFAGPISAPGEKSSADNFEANGTDPEYVWVDGVDKRKIRFVQSTGKLQVLDESDTVLTDDLGDIGTTVESKTANFTAEAAVLYLANHATPATRIIATLPESPTAGDIVTFVGGANTAGFRVKENATSMEAIKFLSSTTAGTGADYWQCADPFRALRVIFDGTQWVVKFAVGAFTNTALVEQHALDSTKPATGTDGTLDSHLATVGQTKSTYFDAVDNKAVEFFLHGKSDATSWLVGRTGELVNPFPQVHAGRLDDLAQGALPSGTVVRLFLLVQFHRANNATDNVIGGWGNPYAAWRYKGSTASPADALTLQTTRDSDGGTDDDTIATPADDSIHVLEVVMTLGADSSTGGFRVATVEAIYDGTSIITKTDRRVGEAISWSTQGKVDVGQPQAFLLTAPIVRMEFP